MQTPSRLVILPMVCLLAGLSLALAPPAWSLAARYTVTDLGPATARAIADDDSRVVGSLNDGGVQLSPTMAPLIGQAPLLRLEPLDTHAGRIVGNASPLVGVITPQAFLRNPNGTIIDLDALLPAPGQGSTATAVTMEDVGGAAWSPDLTRRLPVLWMGDSTPIYLDTLGGNGYVDAMNERGDAVGASEVAPSQWHCTAWPAAGGVVDCHPPGWDAAQSRATDINAAGLSVGVVQLPEVSRGFLTLPYGTVVLEPLAEDTHSLTWGINSLGDIVGQSCRYPDPRGICRATAWLNGTPVDLTTRVTNAQGWTLLTALGISDDGLILGHGLRGVEGHAFLLVPVDNATVAWYKWRYQIARYYQDQYDRWRKSIDWYYREQARAATR